MLNTESKDAAVIHTVDCAKCIPGLRNKVNRRTYMIIIKPLYQARLPYPNAAPRGSRTVGSYFPSGPKYRSGLNTVGLGYTCGSFNTALELK